MSCRHRAEDEEVERFKFAFRCNRLDAFGMVIEWWLCEACLRVAYIDAATGELGDVTVLTPADESVTGIVFRPRVAA